MSNSVEKAPATPYVPTEREKQVVADYAASADMTAVPRMVFVDKSGNVDLSFAHADQNIAQKLIAKALGASSVTAGFSTIKDLINISASSAEIADADNTNQALAVIRGIGPKDHVEMMLATQMVAIHKATVAMSRRLNLATTWPQIDNSERALNKLSRTFATQVEALKRYRSKGEQTVEVKHVHVHDGGQAIVGNVQQGGGKPKNSEGTP
jgi:hypothetical protein